MRHWYGTACEHGSEAGQQARRPKSLYFHFAFPAARDRSRIHASARNSCQKARGLTAIAFLSFLPFRHFFPRCSRPISSRTNTLWKRSWHETDDCSSSVAVTFSIVTALSASATVSRREPSA